MYIINNIIEVLSLKIYDNTLQQILSSILVYFIIALGLGKLIKIIIFKIKKYTTNKKTENLGILFLKIIQNTPKYFFVILEIYIPLKILNLPQNINKILDIIITFVIILEIIRISNKIIIFFVDGTFKEELEQNNKKTTKTAQNIAHLLVNIIVRIIGLLLLLGNIGIEITPLIASLGLGGIAIAFALQNILKDLFSSFSILIAKPFNIGDWIIVGEHKGTVKDITLKSTYISALKGNQIIIPNSKMLTSVIENFGDMKYRKIRTNIGVTYQTETELLKTIPQIIENIIQKIDDVEYERTRLTELATYSINFTISYKINKPDYDTYSKIQEQIFYKILESFEQRGIDIAYPTQTIQNTKNKTQKHLV